MNAISGNLVSKISDHLPQFLIVDNLKVNYKVLNYYKNDFSKFDEEKFINDFSHFYTGLTSQVIIWMPTVNLILSTFRYLKFTNYHVPRRKHSKREFKLSTKPWITKHILAKYDIDINSIPKSLGINIQIQI